MKRTLLILLLLVPALGLSAQENHNFEVSKHLDIFNSLYRDLDLYYVDTLDAKKAVGDAILYMLNQLDPYTEYYPEEETTDLKEMTTGKYAGIGSPIVYRKDLGRCVFSGPYEGMPAAQAGIRTGDIIMSIDGKDVGECGTREPGDYSAYVSRALRGDPGTTFELRVRRPAAGRLLSFKLTRRTVHRPSVGYRTMLSDSVGYVALTGYTDDTARDLRLAVVDLKQRGARRLVLDLRGNPGGLMREAVRIVNLFIPRGQEVLSTKGKVREMNKTYKTTEEPLDTRIPLAVLVNYGTASAAEITSGALQDYDRAVIVGQRTFGKGLVQEPRELPYNTVLKLTTSKYFIPSGRCVQAYDFKNRNADGQPRHLPDSLSEEFYTTSGRTVRDGGGITPDVALVPDTLSPFVAYLAASDELFDYCVRYRNRHARIAPPASFELSEADYADFAAYLRRSGFSYDSRSRRVLDLLRREALREGYADGVQAELDSLEARLTSDLDRELVRWKPDICRLIEANLVENYYYERGLTEYMLRYDKELEEALRILNDEARYRKILSGVPEA